MSRYRDVCRVIQTRNFRVEVFTMPEVVDPADSIAWDDPEAEQEYCEKIYSGELPWVWIGVEVTLHGTNECVGCDSLGCCDFLPFEGEYGTQVTRDLIRQAIAEARKNAPNLRADLDASVNALSNLRSN